MDPPDSGRISVPGRTQEPDGRRLVFAYGTVTLCGRLSHTFLLTGRFLKLPVIQDSPALQPQAYAWFGLLPVRSPLLGE